MYRCLSCNNVFDELKQITEHHNDYYSEHWSGCPHCTSSDIVPVTLCDCGHYADVYFVVEGAGNYCSECVKIQTTKY